MVSSGFKVTYLLLSAGFIASLMSSAEGAKCKGWDMKIYEQDKMWMMECMKEVDAKTPKEAMMMPCFRKCMVIKRGIVDDWGMANKAKAAELVRMTAPEPLQAELVMKVEQCVDMHAGKVKEWKMSCESYVYVCQCMAESFMQTCQMM